MDQFFHCTSKKLLTLKNSKKYLSKLTYITLSHRFTDLSCECKNVVQTCPELTLFLVSVSFLKDGHYKWSWSVASPLNVTCFQFVTVFWGTCTISVVPFLSTPVYRLKPGRLDGLSHATPPASDTGGVVRAPATLLLRRNDPTMHNNNLEITYKCDICCRTHRVPTLQLLFPSSSSPYPSSPSYPSSFLFFPPLKLIFCLPPYRATFWSATVPRMSEGTQRGCDGEILMVRRWDSEMVRR